MNDSRADKRLDFPNGSMLNVLQTWTAARTKGLLVKISFHGCINYYRILTPLPIPIVGRLLLMYRLHLAICTLALVWTKNSKEVKILKREHTVSIETSTTFNSKLKRLWFQDKYGCVSLCEEPVPAIPAGIGTVSPTCHFQLFSLNTMIRNLMSKM